MPKKTVPWLMLGLTLLDQAVKHWTAHRHTVLLPGVLALNYTENTGFSLGLFEHSVAVAVILSAIILCAVLFALFRTPDRSPFLIPLTMICAGAAGNLIDRVLLGFVRDMFELLFVRFYIFNVADVCITAGAGICAALLLCSGKKAAS